MAATPAQFQAAADKIVELAPLENEFVHGGNSVDVPTRNGPVPSMSKIAKTANDQVVTAVLQFGDAAANADRAESAAIAAATVPALGEIASTVAAGRASVADGESFWVRPNSADGLMRFTSFKRLSASTQIAELALFNAGEFDAVLPQNAPPGYAWAVVDPALRAAIGVRDNGIFVANEAELFLVSIGANGGGGAISAECPLGYCWVVFDPAGRVSIGLKNDGAFVASEVNTSTLYAELINGVPVAQIIGGAGAGGSRRTPAFLADVNHTETYGQSLSIGVDTGVAISTSQTADSIEFTPGRGGFAPLTEPCYPAVGPETPSSGTALAVKQLILSENGINHTQQSYQLLFSNNGEGGRSIAQLSKGTSYYNNVIASIQAGYAVAQGLGKTYNFPCFTYTQGEADYASGTDFQTYKAALETLRLDLDAAAKAVTGQANDVQMICYQVGSHKAYGRAYPTIALAQLSAAIDLENVHMACPMYMVTYNADHVHLPARSSKILGFYYGLAYKRIIVDSIDWQPLRPIRKYKQGRVANVTFNVPEGKLVFDTSTVAENTNYGFNLVDAGGNAITIESVSIVGPDTVKVVAATPIPSGAKLQYAFYGAGVSGSISGARGNLRDTQGDRIVLDPDGLNYPAHNWCVIFEETF